MLCCRLVEYPVGCCCQLLDVIGFSVSKLNEHIQTIKFKQSIFITGAGNLECLVFAHENGCSWDSSTCSAAAGNGQLECLKYAHENGCPWSARTCEDAAANGQLECLMYAHENGCEVITTSTL